MKTFAIIFSTFIVVLCLAVALGWIVLPFEKLSTDNVQRQWAFAYQYDESLHASARQICSAQEALKTASTARNATDDSEKIQRRSQLLAYQQNYARIESEYNQKLRNAFEAKYVKPSDVPARAPELNEMLRNTCQ